MDSASLFRAIEKSDISAFRKLIAGHLFLDKRDDEGFTLLHRAAQKGKKEFAEILLEKGADVNSRARWSWTPLHEAARGGHVNTAQILLEYGARLEIFSDWAETPIIVALHARQIRMIYLFLKFNANALQKNRRGKNALNILSMSHKMGSCDNALLEIFIQKGVRIESPFQGLTPLQHAVNNKKSKIAKTLLQHGANPNVFDTFGVTPLHQAVLAEDYDLVSVLLDRNARVNVLTKGECNWAPLHQAVRSGNKKICRLLLLFGADVNLKNGSGICPSDLDRDNVYLYHNEEAKNTC